MKRAARISYRLLTALSLLLLLATAGVWVRSYWVSDRLTWDDWPADLAFLDEKDILCSRGGIRFAALRFLASNIVTPADAHFQRDRKPAMEYPAYRFYFDGGSSSKPHRYAALGFEWIPETTTPWPDVGNIGLRIRALTLPLYFPCLLFAILPAHYVLRVRRRRRIARRVALGCCIACGYDLRASRGRCPECGKAVVSASGGK